MGDPIPCPACGSKTTLDSLIDELEELKDKERWLKEQLKAKATVQVQGLDDLHIGVGDSI